MSLGAKHKVLLPGYRAWLPVVLLGTYLLCFVVILPEFAPYRPNAVHNGQTLQPPGGDFLLGTDLLGRDVFSRVLVGGRRTLIIALIATATAVIPGLIFGTLAGGRRRWLSGLLDILLNSLLALPTLMIALVMMTLLGQNMLSLAIATGIAHIATYASVVRASVQAAWSVPYIEGVRAIGGSSWRILWRHVVPDAGTTLVSYAAVIFAYSILNSAALSFLGLGGDPGVPDWGVILAEGRLIFRSAPWVAVFPGVFITLTVFVFQWASEKIIQGS